MVDDTQLGDFLLTAGLVSRGQLEDVLGHAQGKALSDVLVEQGIVGEDDVRRATAHTLGIPFVVLGRDDISLEALTAIPEPLSRTHNIVSYRADEGTLEIALLDIADLSAVDFLTSKHSAGWRIKPRLTTGDSIKRALLIYQKYLKEKFAGMAHKGAEAADSLLRHALYSHASHIHIEPALVGTLVRYRINGMLHEAMRLPEEAGMFIVEKIKSLAKLFPVASAAQEGRFRFVHPYSAKDTKGEGGEVVAVNVSTIPTVHGEKMLLRLAREQYGQKGFTLESLGFHGEPLERLHKVLQRRSGLVLVCGPKGSGKTTALYTLLDFLNEPGVFIASIEEKIECCLPHVAQAPVRIEVGFGTLAGFRALLRQDPDIVMVGNIDTPEVAELAASASARGMLVLGGTEPARLNDFSHPPGQAIRTGSGGDASLVPDAKIIVFVELMQKLCQQCKEPYMPTRADFAALEDPQTGSANFGRVLAALKEEDIIDKKLAWKDITFYRAVGCEQCSGGYKGVVGIQEVVCPNYRGPSLLEDALFKAAQGLVSVEDLLRAAGLPAQAGE